MGRHSLNQKTQDIAPVPTAYNKPLEQMLAQVAKIRGNDYKLLGTYSFTQSAPKLKLNKKALKFFSTRMQNKPFKTFDEAIKNEHSFANTFIEDFIRNNLAKRYSPETIKLLLSQKVLSKLQDECSKYEVRKYDPNDIYVVYTIDWDKFLDKHEEVLAHALSSLCPRKIR